jgi:hypothetical protein
MSSLQDLNPEQPLENSRNLEIHGIEGTIEGRGDYEKLRLGSTRRNVGMRNVTVKEDTIALFEPLGGPALEMDFHGSLENVEELLARMCSHATVLFH